MRRLLALFALSGLVVMVATSAQAQRPSFQGGGFGQSGYNLLTNKSVQEELKFDDAQKEKLKEVLKELSPKLQEMRKEAGIGGGFNKGGKDLSPEEREKAFAKIVEATKAINETAMKELKPILKDEQYKRFQQIERQQLGMRLFTNAEFAKEIGFTDAQKEKLKTIADETNKDIGEVRESANKEKIDRKETSKKIEAIRKDAMDRILAELKDDQKSKYKELIGEAFEVKFEFPMGNPFGKNRDKKDPEKTDK